MAAQMSGVETLPFGATEFADSGANRDLYSSRRDEEAGEINDEENVSGCDASRRNTCSNR